MVYVGQPEAVVQVKSASISRQEVDDAHFDGLRYSAASTVDLLHTFYANRGQNQENQLGSGTANDPTGNECSESDFRVLLLMLHLPCVFGPRSQLGAHLVRRKTSHRCMNAKKFVCRNALELTAFFGAQKVSSKASSNPSSKPGSQTL